MYFSFKTSPGVTSSATAPEASPDQLTLCFAVTGQSLSHGTVSDRTPSPRASESLVAQLARLVGSAVQGCEE